MRKNYIAAIVAGVSLFGVASICGAERSYLLDPHNVRLADGVDSGHRPNVHLADGVDSGHRPNVRLADGVDSGHRPNVRMV